MIIVLLLSSMANCVMAQKKVELVNDNIAIISCTVSKKEVKFYIKTNGGSPGINVDVNKNGAVDNMVDRSYGIASNSFTICKQFLIDERSSTHCSGAPSNAKLSGERFDYVFTIPLKEMVTPIDREKIHVQFNISVNQNGTWKYYRYPYSSALFGDVFKIDVK
jgi:hypothetical protein